jgi:hypothetical protein
MKRPSESDYTSHVAYTRALEEYCDTLAQPVQEPVAWPCHIIEADFSERTITLGMECSDYKVSSDTHWLSTTPPAQRTWVGLTDEQIKAIDEMALTKNMAIVMTMAALKEKNT